MSDPHDDYEGMLEADNRLYFTIIVVLVAVMIVLVLS